MPRIRHIGILTGGGDCPGINAVIRAVVKTAVHVYGLRRRREFLARAAGHEQRGPGDGGGTRDHTLQHDGTPGECQRALDAARHASAHARTTSPAGTIDSMPETLLPACQYSLAASDARSDAFSPRIARSA